MFFEFPNSDCSVAIEHITHVENVKDEEGRQAGLLIHMSNRHRVFIPDYDRIRFARDMNQLAMKIQLRS